jgi:2-polyprenyl-3-methyl-5-hydroxy-6-metoxy-1,4-benzoquinol methylase
MMTKNNIHSASFRDPSGFLFWSDGILYRQVNVSYQTHYDALMQSGLYAQLIKRGHLVRHEEVDQKPAYPEIAYKVIAPEKVSFISYPYEWSFSELRDAALLTLEVCNLALEKGLVLKDASAYNIQFVDGRPVLIDTLSFEKYQEGAPWVAYRQFCQHFLAPLALMACTDIRLSQLMRVYIDGIPLDLASKLLPGSTQWKLGITTHIHIHAKTQQKYAGKAISHEETQRSISKTSMLGLLDSLKGTVNSLKWEPSGTEWADYYDITNYSGEAFEEKKAVIRKFIDIAAPGSVWDLGANNGIFSRLASEKGIPTVAADIDPSAVELGYLQVKKEKTKNLLPLVLDLTNPSAGAGWNNEERQSFTQRGPVDLVMALALIHHLAISNNVPLVRVAESFSQMGKWLIIEFVPKSDSQVQRLLSSRLDIFENYTQDGFEESFNKYYTIEQKVPVKDSQRTLYLMRVLE